MIACQLQASNGNTVAAVLNNNPGGTVTSEGSAGPFEGCTIYKWTGTTYATDVGDNILSGNISGWDNNGTVTLNPGEAAWFQNPYKTNLSALFLGTVPSGTLTVNIPGTNKFSMISSPVPVAGDIVTNAVMNFTNYNQGDTLYVWNNPSGTGSYTTYTVDSLGGFGYQGGWDSPGDPSVAVGQGFWYKSAPTSPTITWTETFSVSNP